MKKSTATPILRSVVTTLALVILMHTQVRADISLTPAAGGTNLTADRASNSTTPQWTTLTNIILSEPGNDKGAFHQGTNVTLTLIAPSGWAFNTAGVTVTFTAGRDITAASVTGNNGSVITITYTVVGLDDTDHMEIGNMRVRAIDGANVPGAGNIVKGGTGTITGCPSGTTMGSLSQVAGSTYRLVLTLPNEVFTDGTSVATSGNSGTVQAQEFGTSFNLSRLTAIDQFYNIVTGYSGVKTIAYSGPTSSPPHTNEYTTSVTFTSGQATSLATTIYRAQSTFITANETAPGSLAGIASSLLTINPRYITVTADPKSKLYGATDPALTSQITSGALIPGDELTGEMYRLPGESVGPYAIEQGTLAAEEDYVMTFVGNTFTIGQAPLSITADNKSKTYDGAVYSPFTVTYAGFAFSEGPEVLTGTLAFTGSAVTAINAGLGYVITPGGLGSTNYDITFYNGLLDIFQREITITADAKEKCAGDTDPALTYQVTSGTVITGDNPSGALSRTAGESPGFYPILQNTLTFGANYDETYIGASLEIHPLPTATLGGIIYACYNTPTNVSVVLTGTPPWSYTWSDGTNSGTISNVPASPSTFAITPTDNLSVTITEVTDGNNCENTGTGSTTVYTGPITTAANVFACAGNIIEVPITVKSFDDVGAISLTLKYTKAVMTYHSFINNSGLISYIGAHDEGSYQVVKFSGIPAPPTGNLPDNAVLITLKFSYISGNTPILWDDAVDVWCEYASDDFESEPFCDSPTATYYINGSVTQFFPQTLAADFTADNLTPPKFTTVTFDNTSTGAGVTYLWSITPATFNFVGGTSATSFEPQVQFTNGGLYTVSLTITDPCGSDTETKTGYIRAGIHGLWIGRVSTEWNTSTNWDDDLTPNNLTNVMIKVSAKENHWPKFTGDLLVGIDPLAHCKSITFDGNGYMLTVKGKITTVANGGNNTVRAVSGGTGNIMFEAP